MTKKIINSLPKSNKSKHGNNNSVTYRKAKKLKIFINSRKFLGKISENFEPRLFEYRIKNVLKRSFLGILRLWYSRINQSDFHLNFYLNFIQLLYFFKYSKK